MKVMRGFFGKLAQELYVFPPKRPQLKGSVERGNRTFREDFYDAETFIPGSVPKATLQL